MRVLVGISGGVDSAYCVKLLKDRGYDVECAILIMHEYTEVNEAKAVAEKLGVRLHTVDCRKQFSEIVKENLVDEYLRARTPNPCILCNEKVKFKYLYDYAMEQGFDAIATGHYAALYVKEGDSYLPYEPSAANASLGSVLVGVGQDTKKDQSYMLWRVPEYILRKLILPLSALKKEDIISETERLIPSLSGKRESQEICFLKDLSYADYIETKRGKSEKGNFIDSEGRIIGRHDGIIRYTVGQRKGLGVSASSRLFVTDINPKTNEITLSSEDKLYSKAYLSEVRLYGNICTDKEIPISVKLRYSQRTAPAILRVNGDRATLILLSPQRAVTPGQSAVFYDGNIVVGGGIIDEAE